METEWSVGTYSGPPQFEKLARKNPQLASINKSVNQEMSKLRKWAFIAGHCHNGVTLEEIIESALQTRLALLFCSDEKTKAQLDLWVVATREILLREGAIHFRGPQADFNIYLLAIVGAGLSLAKTLLENPAFLDENSFEFDDLVDKSFDQLLRDDKNQL